MTEGPASRLSISLSDWAKLLFLSVVWGGSFVLAQISVAEVPPLTITFARCITAAIVLWGAMRAAGQRLPADGAEWGRYVPLALFNIVLSFTFMFWAQKYVPGGLAAILFATTPLLTVLMAHFVTSDDRISTARIVGLVAGFAGVVAMIGPELLQEIGINVLAPGGVILAALFSAMGGLYGRRLRGRSPLVMATAQVMIAAVVLGPLSLWFDRVWLMPTPSVLAIGAILGLGVVSTAFGTVLFFHILGRIGATNVQLVTFMQPPTAVLLTTLLLGERLAPSHFVGMAFIAVGLAAIDGRPAKYLAGRVRLWRGTA